MKARDTASAAVAGLAAMWLAAGPASATDPDDFILRSTADFVDVCETPQDDADYRAAIHFCHGYAVGVYQYYQTLAGEGAGELVCLPDPPPTRSDAIKQFLAWAKSNQQYMSQPAAENIMRFLIEEWGCS